MYYILCHAAVSRKIEQWNGLLNYTESNGTWDFKHCDTHLAKAAWLVNTRGYTNRADPAQSKLPYTVG